MPEPPLVLPPPEPPVVPPPVVPPVALVPPEVGPEELLELGVEAALVPEEAAELLDDVAGAELAAADVVVVEDDVVVVEVVEEEVLKLAEDAPGMVSEGRFASVDGVLEPPPQALRPRASARPQHRAARGAARRLTPER